MNIEPLQEQDKHRYNQVVIHPLQSYEWGEFKEKTNVKVIRRVIKDKEKIVDGFQVMIHRIPHLPFTIGYMPKAPLPTPLVLKELITIGRQEKCIFIQLEPNSIQEESKDIIGILEKKFPLQKAFHPLFTKHSFQLPLTPSEEILLQQMNQKTRYNIRLAKKRNVVIKEETTSSAFDIYWSLMQETTTRQHFYNHSKLYHEQMWKTLSNAKEGLRAHLFIAYYTPPEEKRPIPLTAWILFTFHSTLYYPYGASSKQYKEVMASNLMMWEAIRFGKKHNLSLFDMWGALGQHPDPKHPWYGFHRFKQGYGASLVTFSGSYDLVINPFLYKGYMIADNIRWFMLKLRK